MHLCKLGTLLSVAVYLLSTCLAAGAGTTTTTLAITVSGAPVTSISAGTAITLTATVLSGSAAVSPGVVNFCDAAAAYCTDVHVLGTAQLTSAGTAVIHFVPSPGSRSFKAIFAGTKIAAGSTSSSASLAVSGTLPTTTAVVANGSTVTATVSGSAFSSPTGTVSVLDASDESIVLGTPDLVADSAITLPSHPSLTTSNIDSAIPGTGDFNNDGITDIAVTAGNGTSFLLSDGKGGFTASDWHHVDLPRHMASGDFNNDGNADMAITNNSDNSVAIFLGNGHGVFTAGSTPATGVAPYVIATADFDGDGNADLAVENFGDNSVTILLGQGNGTFTAATARVPTDTHVFSLTTADLNNDGKPDLVVLQGDALNIFLGVGDGTFIAVATSIPLPDGGVAVFAADLDGDGKADLVALQNDKVTLLHGNGDGTFTPLAPWVWSTGAGSNALVVADLNGDGIPDLAVLDWTYVLTEAFGKGDGTFPQSAISAPLFPFTATQLTDPDPDAIPQMVPGYFYNDGIAEIAAMNWTQVYGVTTIQATATSTATATGLVLPHNSGGQKVVGHYTGDASHSGGAGSAYDGPFVVLSTKSLLFPATRAGEVSAYQQVSVTNIGNETLNLGQVEITNTTDPYSWGMRENECGSTLPSGTTCTFMVVFRPTRTGPITAMVSIDDNGQWLKQQVALSGSGK